MDPATNLGTKAENSNFMTSETTTKYITHGLRNNHEAMMNVDEGGGESTTSRGCVLQKPSIPERF